MESPAAGDKSATAWQDLIGAALCVRLINEMEVIRDLF
jgi:hypothetical protein